MTVNYTIDLKGMGIIVNRPLDIIVKALEDAGAEVTVENHYPSEVKWRDYENPLVDYKVKIKVEHEPWPG